MFVFGIIFAAVSQSMSETEFSMGVAAVVGLRYWQRSEQRNHCGGHGRRNKAPVHGGELHAHMHVQHADTGERAALGASMRTHSRSVQPSEPPSVGSHGFQPQSPSEMHV